MTKETKIGAGLLAALIAAQPVAAVAEGEYLKLQLGTFAPTAEDEYWRPHGYPDDPQVNFDIGAMDNTGFASVAIGKSFGNNIRGDVELLVTGATDATGACDSASDGTPCSEHADITDAKFKTSALMANVSYDFAMSGKLQPYVTAGVGVARNKVTSWTRTANPDNDTTRPVRTFSDDTNVDLAWSVGAGVTYDLGQVKRPMFLDMSYRYFNLGEAQGGSTPDDTGEIPVKALNFDVTGHVLAVGVRIPF
ncbi:MAG: porin family protein [Thalassococcus sp.]|uniref:outer membrane protein n=1 Tax=Thalassococcus sp. TaxID=1928858 RepID=UPI001B1D9098|nr:outer membrane beta-barrel protein [Thalassococcus sp.]MBO6867312.1 porin family protein [Thalassococcus sp.]